MIRHVLPVRYSRSLTGVKECLGFNVAFVAYPAEYRSSGVMTFIVNADGVVHQKEIGKKTEAIGKAMKEYNRDSSWQKAEGGTRRNRGQIKGVACASSVKCFSFVPVNANGALDDALAAFAAW